MEFTAWQSELAHYGVPGMKWGVRRYVNSNGFITKHGEKRYGYNGTGASKRRMQKDFNRLDQSFANLNAWRNWAAVKLNNYGTRLLARKEKLEKKGLDAKTDKKIAKLQKNADRQAAIFGRNIYAMASVSSLQKGIYSAVKKNGQKFALEQIVRHGNIHVSNFKDNFIVGENPLRSEHNMIAGRKLKIS